jgi:c-di-GMP-binding flagellar brake protein YcgR
MSWNGSVERRKYTRARVRLHLEFVGQGEPESPPVELQTLNLSAGGFYCRVSRALEPLTRLALRFEFPPFGAEPTEARTVECQAVVVRCEAGDPPDGGYRVGACFTSMTPEDRRHVDRYVAWYREVFEGGAPESAERPDDAERAA